MSNRNYNNAGNWGRGGKAAASPRSNNNNNRGNQQPYRGGRLSRDMYEYNKLVEKEHNDAIREDQNAQYNNRQRQNGNVNQQRGNQHFPQGRDGPSSSAARRRPPAALLQQNDFTRSEARVAMAMEKMKTALKPKHRRPPKKQLPEQGQQQQRQATGQGKENGNKQQQPTKSNEAENNTMNKDQSRPPHAEPPNRMPNGQPRRRRPPPPMDPNIALQQRRDGKQPAGSAGSRSNNSTDMGSDQQGTSAMANRDHGESEERQRTYEIVGVITIGSLSAEIAQIKGPPSKGKNNYSSKNDNSCVEFLVFNFQKRCFLYSIPVVAKDLPSCNPGSWLRLIIGNHFRLEEVKRKPVVPWRAIPCQRRLITRYFDGHVNFLMTASRKRNAISPSPDKITYACKLGKLYIDKERLKDPDLFIGEATSSDSEDLIPEQLSLWCHPCISDRITGVEYEDEIYYSDPILELQRIDERFYAAEEQEDVTAKKEDFPTSQMDNGESNNGDLQLPELFQNGCALATSPLPPELSAHFSDWLSQMILRNYEANRLSTQRRTQIDDFVEDLQKFMRKKLGIPKIQLKVFGSINSGFGSDESDLDICVVDLPGMDSEDQLKSLKRRRLLLTSLAKQLREDQTFDQVIAVLDARTPICKFEHRQTGFHGDISIENRLALYNTELLKLYTEFDERVAPLGFAIKRWAKLLGLNDASTGSISSYAYIVMLISFLQRTQPPVLPFLQELPRDEKLPTGLVEGCRVAYSTDLASIRAQPQFCNRQSLGELFRDFLRHFGRKFSILEDVAQIRTSGEYGKRERSPDEPLKHRLCVEDPFDLDHNLTSGVREETLDHILKCMRSTQQGLEKFDKDHFGPQTAEQPEESKSSSEHSSREELPTDFSRLMVMFKTRRTVQVKRKVPKKKNVAQKEAGEQPQEVDGVKVSGTEKASNEKDGLKHENGTANEGKPPPKKRSNINQALRQVRNNVVANRMKKQPTVFTRNRPRLPPRPPTANQSSSTGSSSNINTNSSSSSGPNVTESTSSDSRAAKTASSTTSGISSSGEAIASGSSASSDAKSALSSRPSSSAAQTTATSSSSN